MRILLTKNCRAERSFPAPCGARVGRVAALAALASITLAAVTAVHAQDRADLEGTRIIGNRELPKVLYIVPWKKPLQGELSGKPLASVLDEALAPVDRDVFRRQVAYDAQLRAHQIPAAAQAAPMSPAAQDAPRP